MVPGDEHPSLIHRSGPGDDIERDLLALEEVLIASGSTWPTARAWLVPR